MSDTDKEMFALIKTGLSDLMDDSHGDVIESVWESMFSGDIEITDEEDAEYTHSYNVIFEALVADLRSHLETIKLDRLMNRPFKVDDRVFGSFMGVYRPGVITKFAEHTSKNTGLRWWWVTLDDSPTDYKNQIFCEESMKLI